MNMIGWIIGYIDRWVEYYWPPPREVIFGRKSLDGGYGLAHHWAIKVGKTWYEVEGTSIREKGLANSIAASDGLVSKCGAKPCKVPTIDETVIKDWKIGYCQNGSILVFLAMIFTGSIWLFFAFIGLAFFSSWVFKIKKPEYIDAIGTTERTDEEIKVFNEAFLENNPTYHVLTRNCQDYANVFSQFLMEKGDRQGWLPKVESPRKTTTKMSVDKLKNKLFEEKF